jgi:nitroreductase
MEVFEAVHTVLAVREYQDKPVPPETVRRIVEAGRLTGSSMNRQPWHFIVVQNRDTLRQLGALAKTGPYVAQAALAIVVAIQSAVRGFGWKPRDPIDDVDSLVRRSRLELGWLYGNEGSQTASGYSG